MKTNGEIAVPSIEEQQRIIEERNRATRQAMAEPLPGQLSEAFLAEDIVAEGVRVRPLMAGDWLLFKQLNSPIYRNILEMDKPEAERKEMILEDDMEAFQMIYQFTRPASAVRSELRKGMDVFKETVLREVADRYHPALVSKLVTAVAEQVRRSFETAMKYGNDREPEGQKSFSSPA